jgi:AGZA family xanthine/uracil permease-like MFS transporter
MYPFSNKQSNKQIEEDIVSYNLLEDEKSEGNLVVVMESSDDDLSMIIVPNIKFMFIDNFFKISESGSTIKRELYAGIINFLSMSYILACNPSILSISGIPIHSASSGTCLSTAVATFIAGIFGNIPIGCAPGVGLSAFFSYSVMSEINYNDNLGLLIVFFSGFIVFLLTLLKITPYIINHIPIFMKMSTIVGMGLFLSLVGLTTIGLVKKGEESVLMLGDLGDWKIWLFMLNLLLISILEMKKIHGSMILSIISVALLYFIISEEWPQSFVSIPIFKNVTDVLNYDNFKLFINLPIGAILSIMVSFILVLILDVGGVIFDITKMGNLPESKKRTKWALLSASIGTMVAAIFGCSPIIVHIESVAGVLVGGRTGLTSVTTSLLFLLSIILSPFFNNLPECSTIPITIFIGALMMKQCKEIDWDKIDIALPAFLTIIMMPFTFSISYGIFFGLVSYFIFTLLKKETWLKITRKIYKTDEINIREIENNSDMSLCDS